MVNNQFHISCRADYDLVFLIQLIQHSKPRSPGSLLPVRWRTRWSLNAGARLREGGGKEERAWQRDCHAVTWNFETELWEFPGGRSLPSRTFPDTMHLLFNTSAPFFF